MNPEKLKKMQTQVRIGGKGTPRRKKKIVHSSQANDDRKLQSSLKKLSVSTILGIEEVNLIKDDGTVIHFDVPDVQACLTANTFAISGRSENKAIIDMLPEILSHLGPDGISQLSNLLPEDDEDVPDLVENFDEASKNEVETINLEKEPQEEDSQEEEPQEEVSQEDPQEEVSQEDPQEEASQEEVLQEEAQEDDPKVEEPEEYDPDEDDSDEDDPEEDDPQQNDPQEVGSQEKDPQEGGPQEKDPEEVGSPEKEPQEN